MHQLVSGLATVLQELADQGIANVANHVEAWLLAKTALRGHLSAEEQNKADFDFGQLFHWRHHRSTHSAPAVVEPAVVEPAVVEPAVVEPAVVEPAAQAAVEPTPASVPEPAPAPAVTNS